jgi:hypothetical protein
MPLKVRQSSHTFPKYLHDEDFNVIHNSSVGDGSKQGGSRLFICQYSGFASFHR